MKIDFVVIAENIKIKIRLDFAMQILFIKMMLNFVNAWKYVTTIKIVLDSHMDLTI
jgi:hypothetical protein